MSRKRQFETMPVEGGSPGLSRRGFLATACAGAMSVGLSSPSRAAALSEDDAIAAAESRRDELIELLSELIRIQSLSGESAEAAQTVVARYLGQLPYRIESSSDRPSDYVQHAEYMTPNPPGDGPFVNVVATPERGSRRALFAHIDTHIVADGWTTEPFEPVIRGRRLYGLGAADDKGGIAAMLVAAAALADIGGPLPVVMSLHGKGGGSRGSLPIFERHRNRGSDIDAVLYVHPAETGRGLADIKNEVLGVFDMTLAVEGWRAPPMEINSIDSSPWDAGGNALDVCIAALADLRSSVFASTPFNLGELEGGDRSGSVAERARAQFRIKFSGDDTWSDLLDAARMRLSAFEDRLPSADGDFKITLEPAVYRTNPGAADWDAPVSRVLRDAIESVTGRAPDSYPNHYAGDIRYPIRLLGVPAYGIGSLGGGFYGPNEWVDLDDLVRLVAVVMRTVDGWAAA